MSCAVMFIVTTACIIIFEHYIPVDTKKFQILELAVSVMVGGATYVAMALILKMQEVTPVIGMIKRKLRG